MGGHSIRTSTTGAKGFVLRDPPSCKGTSASTLRTEIAELSAERDMLAAKLAERDQQVAAARKDAAVFEADCAALRVRLPSEQVGNRRTGVDRRLGGA